MAAGRMPGKSQPDIRFSPALIPGASREIPVPVFRSHDCPPDWCELRSFEIIDLAEARTARRRRTEPRERLLVVAGTVQLAGYATSIVLKENQFLDVEAHADLAEWTARACSPAAQLTRLSGRWGGDIAGCGIFQVTSEEGLPNNGDPVDYAMKTRVDSHYHDCDEYWVLLEGRARVVVGGKAMEMGPGDCVGIGMGHHHDMPIVHEPVKAVFFETTLEGRKRVGHLWNHTHGPAEPRPERI
jgi:mannose-6-phosphate isomerase-like protein (cupin superfamily)